MFSTCTFEFLATNSLLERIGVALFGAGRIGLVHLNNILANQRFDLLYVVDAVETVRSKFRIFGNNVYGSRIRNQAAFRRSYM
jgi:hypothetical protein